MPSELVHGMNAVREALQSKRAINRVYFAKESRAHGCKELAAQVKAAGIRFDFVPQAKLNELTGTQEHQGVAAVLSPAAYTTLEVCLAQCPQNARLLVVDQVQHPKNLGLLIRTATGAGVHAVLICERGGALLDETVVRASAGTVLRMPIVPCKNLAQTLRKLRDADFWIYALDANGAQNALTMDWPERHALVVGNETKGIRPGVLKVCDATVAIPLDNKLDSLNVAVATGIALFQGRPAL